MNNLTIQEMKDFVSTARTILSLRKSIERELNSLMQNVLDNYEKSVCNLIQKGKSYELEELVNQMEREINKQETNELCRFAEKLVTT